MPRFHGALHTSVFGRSNDVRWYYGAIKVPACQMYLQLKRSVIAGIQDSPQ